jgi:hypothetical protein
MRQDEVASAMSEELLDPFSLHVALRDEGQSAELKGRFEGGEHAWLGSKGAELACAGDEQLLQSLRNLRRPNDKGVLTYGEIVALSGDFYAHAEDLFQEKPPKLPWFKGTNDLGELRQALSNELDWIQEENRHGLAGYPDNTLTFVWTAKSYVELAEDNTAHFGWHNIKRYCENHAQALAYAVQAESRTVSDVNWMRAVFHNGFADHFLTDGFAAGHIRVPRQQIRDWAPSQNYGGKLAGLLSKVLHDQDGHVHEFHGKGEKPLSVDEGLPVRNSRGCEWSARCDGQMFLVASKQADALIAEPVSAVAASLVEVLEAQRTKRAPAGEYAALKFVPFPRPGAQTLVDKFANTSSDYVDELLESFSWYLQLEFLKPLTDASLDAANVSSLFRALPELMQQFRQSVAVEYESRADLQERLPKPYVDGFRSIG